MNVGIFGGTFDPVHRGHLAVARAARDAHQLDRIFFVPADLPPHKQKLPITAFEHRYAMLTLALRAHPAFVPSLIESRRMISGPDRGKPSYTIETVRRFRAMLSRRDRLFFLIGIDAFRDLPTWYKPRELMREVEFIVVSRPGFRMADAKFFDGNSGGRARNLNAAEARIHLVTGVSEDVSSTALRAHLMKGKVAGGMLDEAVVDYIRKEHLYGVREKARPASSRARP